MKELGNLAIVCAQRPDVLMQIHGAWWLSMWEPAANGPPYIVPGATTRGSAASSMS